MKRTAFTLLELTITISIIALLAGLLLPVFAQSRERARGTSCASNLAQIGLALHLYAQDHDGHFPAGTGNALALDNYARNEHVFACPSHGQLNPLPFPGRMVPNYSSYRYRPGRSNDDSGKLRLVFDSEFRHLDCANVLFLNGTARRVRRGEWKSFGWDDPTSATSPLFPSWPNMEKAKAP